MQGESYISETKYFTEQCFIQKLFDFEGMHKIIGLTLDNRRSHEDHLIYLNENSHFALDSFSLPRKFFKILQ